jgi:glutathione S-transferase
VILIGQYDSPFVRRVAIALNLYGHSYEHGPWSAFSDAGVLGGLNPLRRVPALSLDDGECLFECAAILDHLDELAAPISRLLAPSGRARRSGLRTTALASGMCDKMISLIYERAFHPTVAEEWVRRCLTQVLGALGALETECSVLPNPYWHGTAPGHADAAVACAIRFLQEAHPDIAAAGSWPFLTAHSARCEELAAFHSVVQQFAPPGDRLRE